MQWFRSVRRASQAVKSSLKQMIASGGDWVLSASALVSRLSDNVS